MLNYGDDCCAQTPGMKYFQDSTFPLSIHTNNLSPGLQNLKDLSAIIHWVTEILKRMTAETHF